MNLQTTLRALQQAGYPDARAIPADDESVDDSIALDKDGRCSVQLGGGYFYGWFHPLPEDHPDFCGYMGAERSNPIAAAKDAIALRDKHAAEYLPACTVTFTGEEAYPARSLGTTWNGFDNVLVTPETLAEMVAAERAECGADSETAAEMEALPVNAGGMVDLSNGYATQIVEPETPKYMAEFPDFDFEVPTLITGNPNWEDISWGADTNPSFECDVFVLQIDYTDRMKREFPLGPQFSMVCEGEVMLATDSWEDIRAFIEDGKRHFDEVPAKAPIVILTAEFAAYVEREGLPKEGDATDLLMGATLKPEQALWLQNFVTVWEEEAASDPDFYAKQPVVEA